MKQALEAPPPGVPDKADPTLCDKALMSDVLWRRSMVVLSAYSQRLSALAAGEGPETAGKLQAAMTGIRGEDWIEVEPAEQSARSAAAKLVAQMEAADDKSDFDKTVQDAAPHVNTLCSGLRSYLEARANEFGEIRAEIDKKREAKTDRRCATFDNRTICTSESATDRVVHAGMLTDLTVQELNHLDARDDVAGFCAAHSKLAAAAGSGDTGKAETYTAVVEAVRSTPRAKPPKPAPASPEASDKPAAGDKKFVSP